MHIVVRCASNKYHLVSSSRNCLYKHKLRKHKTTVKVARSLKDKHVVCPECKTTDARYVSVLPNNFFGVYTTII